MDKISLALQRVLENGGAESAAYPGARNMSPAGSSTRRPGEIAYTHTRCLDLDPAVLERHRLASVRNDTSADAFRLLRTQILMQMRQHGWQTLAVTSPNKGAGKSTIALNLAMSFAIFVIGAVLFRQAKPAFPDVL